MTVHDVGLSQYLHVYCWHILEQKFQYINVLHALVYLKRKYNWKILYPDVIQIFHNFGWLQLIFIFHYLIVWKLFCC